VTRRAAAARIAEGGFAKGLALDAALGAVRVIDGLDAVVLDLGGQLAWWTAATAAPAMGRVGVAAPRRRDHAVGWIDLPAAGSLATSGNSERSITVAGAPSSHILDPRNGHPVVDWGSVTVLVTAPQDDAAMAADCLSTALYVLGPNAGLACASGLPGVQALFLEHTADGLRWHLTPGMRRVVRLAPDHSSSAACRRSRLHPPQPTTKQTPPR
jgi:thiamine biosynthesis lipoprotein